MSHFDNCDVPHYLGDEPLDTSFNSNALQFEYYCEDCSWGYFWSESWWTCIECDVALIGCVSCDNFGSKCLECENDYYLSEDRCYKKQGPINCYLANGNTCSECNAGWTKDARGECTISCRTLDKNCLECLPNSDFTKIRPMYLMPRKHGFRQRSMHIPRMQRIPDTLECCSVS